MQKESRLVSFYKGCPGGVSFRKVRPDYIECPFCSAEMEIWSDEPLAECPSCGREVTQSRGASCIDWCAYTRECVGSEKYEQLMHMLENTAAEAETDA